MLPALPCDIDERYTIVAELGHGSHAIVYRAVDRMLDREVAIKVLRSELVDSDVSERFRREIRLTSQLEHPHIAHVYGTGEFLGTPYFVTALARGASLAERLTRERQLPVDEALAIAKEIASALGHAHRAGIIHRDVKPANILLTPDGALLTDFGVARALELSPGTLATSTGVAVGTLLYMSPEQLCAEKGIDARSDQYALALVLYEMLAGVSAHVAANAEGLRALRVAGQHVSLRTLRASVPESVDVAIDRALSSAPADRYRDVPTFVSALDGLVESTGSRRSSGTPPTVSPVVRPTRRRWFVAGGLVSLVAAVGAYGVIKVRRDLLTRGDSAPGANGYAFTLMSIGDTSLSAPVVRALSAELGEWPDVSVDVAQGRVSPRELDTRVTRIGGGLQATILLRDAVMPARTVRVRFPTMTSPDADSLRLLAARVLMAVVVSPDSAESLNVVTSRATAAVQDFARGWQAILRGDLSAAQALFADAARTTAVPQAALWQTTVASWLQPAKTVSWRESARVSAERASVLGERDSLLAIALLMRALDRMPAACEAFSRATHINGGTFAAWYGLGECMRTDSIVVSDATSPTGNRFRTSHWSAARAYESAIARLPSHEIAFLFDRLQSEGLTIGAGLRQGWKTDRGRYDGLPMLQGDSIASYPISRGELIAGGVTRVPKSFQAAVRLGRSRMLELATFLAARASTSASAQLMHARALEYADILSARGRDPSALEIVSRAEKLSRTWQDSINAGLLETRIRLRLADYVGANRSARQLLSSASSVTRSEAQALVPVAVLVNRFALAESLLVRATSLAPGHADGLDGLSAPLARAHAHYAAAAAAGLCDSLIPLRSALRDAMESHFSQEELKSALQRWLAPTDWLGLTCAGAPNPEGANLADPVLQVFSALRSGDTLLAVRRVREMQSRRRVRAAQGAIAWDTRFAEVWVLTQSRELDDARTRLALAFDELSGTMDYVLFDIAQSAALRRSLALCAELEWPDEKGRIRQSGCRGALRALSVTA